MKSEQAAGGEQDERHQGRNAQQAPPLDTCRSRDRRQRRAGEPGKGQGGDRRQEEVGGGSQQPEEGRRGVDRDVVDRQRREGIVGTDEEEDAARGADGAGPQEEGGPGGHRHRARQLQCGQEQAGRCQEGASPAGDAAPGRQLLRRAPIREVRDHQLVADGRSQRHADGEQPLPSDPPPVAILVALEEVRQLVGPRMRQADLGAGRLDRAPVRQEVELERALGFSERRHGRRTHEKLRHQPQPGELVDRQGVEPGRFFATRHQENRSRTRGREKLLGSERAVSGPRERLPLGAIEGQAIALRRKAGVAMRLLQELESGRWIPGVPPALAERAHQLLEEPGKVLVQERRAGQQAICGPGFPMRHHPRRAGLLDGDQPADQDRRGGQTQSRAARRPGEPAADRTPGQRHESQSGRQQEKEAHRRGEEAEVPGQIDADCREEQRLDEQDQRGERHVT